MIICFDKDTKVIKSIITGKNPNPPYGDDISNIDIPEQYFIVKKGDKVYIDEKSQTAKIGSNVVKIQINEFTAITLENYTGEILLEEL